MTAPRDGFECLVWKAGKNRLVRFTNEIIKRIIMKVNRDKLGGFENESGGESRREIQKELTGVCEMKRDKVLRCGEARCDSTLSRRGPLPRAILFGRRRSRRAREQKLYLGIVVSRVGGHAVLSKSRSTLSDARLAFCFIAFNCGIYCRASILSDIICLFVKLNSDTSGQILVLYTTLVCGTARVIKIVWIIREMTRLIIRHVNTLWNDSLSSVLKNIQSFV